MLSVELGDTRSSTYDLEALACVAAAQGRARWAARLFGLADGLREPMGNFISATLRSDRNCGSRTACARLGREAYAVEWSAGCRMSLDQVMVILEANAKLVPRPKDQGTSRAPTNSSSSLDEPPTGQMQICSGGLATHCGSS
jgi:hypothetical protein